MSRPASNRAVPRGVSGTTATAASLLGHEILARMARARALEALLTAGPRDARPVNATGSRLHLQHAPDRHPWRPARCREEIFRLRVGVGSSRPGSAAWTRRAGQRWSGRRRSHGGRSRHRRANQRDFRGTQQRGPLPGGTLAVGNPREQLLDRLFLRARTIAAASTSGRAGAVRSPGSATPTAADVEGFRARCPHAAEHRVDDDRVGRVTARAWRAQCCLARAGWQAPIEAASCCRTSQAGSSRSFSTAACRGWFGSAEPSLGDADSDCAHVPRRIVKRADRRSRARSHRARPASTARGDASAHPCGSRASLPSAGTADRVAAFDQQALSGIAMPSVGWSSVATSCAGVRLRSMGDGSRRVVSWTTR